MKVKQLDLNEVRWVYDAHLALDYPERERKPLKTIQSLYKKGVYHCYAMMEGELVVAYAFFCQKGDWLLLDYFAVSAAFRGQGYGSRLLQGMRLFYPKLGLLTQVKDPDRCPAPEEGRSRRCINFYQKLGFVLTPIRVMLRAEEYLVLAWTPPNTAPTTQQIYTALEGLHRDCPDPRETKLIQPPAGPKQEVQGFQETAGA